MCIQSLQPYITVTLLCVRDIIIGSYEKGLHVKGWRDSDLVLPLGPVIDPRGWYRRRDTQSPPKVSDYQ